MLHALGSDSMGLTAPMHNKHTYNQQQQHHRQQQQQGLQPKQWP